MTARGGGQRGELRQMLAQVFGAASEAMTWRAAAAELVAVGHLPSVGASELVMIRRTVENMARSGELMRCGDVRRPGSCRPMATFRVFAPAEAPAATAWHLMAQALQPRDRDL